MEFYHVCLWGFMDDFDDGEEDEVDDEWGELVNSRNKGIRDLFGISPTETITAVGEDGTERVVGTNDDSDLFSNMVY